MTKRRKTAISPAENNTGDDGVADHRLCGYLRTVVAIVPPHDSQTLPTHNARCKVSINDSGGIELECDNGVVLVPIASTSSRKRWSRIGMVQGSLSVVRQAQALLINRCLRIIARVIGVSARKDHVRVLVLVDVYLPNAVWSETPGWQFPKSGPIAAAFCKHLSCDWEARQLMLASTELGLSDCEIWNVPDCHAVDCKHQCSVPEAPVGKFFELHEIFTSLPSVMEAPNLNLSSVIYPASTSDETGIWQLSDDVIIQILSLLAPVDLVRVSASCHHLGSLAATIIPCGKLRLFPHQQAAVEWMLLREQGPRVFQDPFYVPFFTEDGFHLYINVVSGKIVAGATAPSVTDFRGGMFCDEPGLGKTVTALSLILKTQGTLAHPPDGAQVSWCNHNFDQRCAYYEVRTQNLGSANKSRRGQFSPGQNSDICTPSNSEKSGENSCGSGMISEKGRTRRFPLSASKDLHQARRNLLNQYEEAFVVTGDETTPRRLTGKRKQVSGGPKLNSLLCSSKESLFKKRKRPEMVYDDDCMVSDTWVQCEGCGKWRKLVDATEADTSRAWFCSMNNDPLHQNCNVPEETDKYESITHFPGFCAKGSPGGLEENISFFIGVLKEHKDLLNYKTDKVLKWLVKLSPDKLSEMETVGLAHSVSQISLTDGEHEYHKLFQAFGLIKKVEKHVTRWYYPRTIANLVFDLSALIIALDEPLDSSRFYLSRATLIVVPANLVDHWKTQIQKHVSRGQLRVYIWNEHKKSQKKPSPHHLAWDYDVVITTFSRLSAEWSQRQRSTLMQVHWLRVVLDEGHTLGSSLSLTNKLQMAVFLRASSRWVLTGTPTPNTPSSQLSHLHPMLKFLHEESYGLNQKSWEDGILRPFEAEMEEGRLRLLQLLQRCMISARKADLKSIPPCIKRVTFLDFTEEHARTYNELLETVRRNILLADWNDPSHVESLLNPKQWKFRSATIRNLRLSCCVAGHIRVMDAGQDIQETMDILQETGLDQNSQEYEVIKFNILYGGSCVRCREWCRLPFITPCRHLLCLDCVALESTMCPLAGCGRFYEMQSPDALTRPENPNPKWPVPKDLIELQPSYKQDDWHPDWQSTSSSKVSYLVNRLKLLRETNGLVGSSNEEKGVKSPEQFNFTPQRCNFYNNQQPDDVLELKCHSTSKILEKVIIFSQFLEHIHVIEQQLTIAGIQYAGLYNPMPSAKKMASLATFQNDATCMALLMDGSAALGLDLSFVTHVYLMEPIWDKSMEEQVISRAHRMGATRPIFVETLAMSGTIEEQMLKFLDVDDGKRLLKDDSSKHDDTARVHRTLHDLAESNYLTQLKYVRTN